MAVNKEIPAYARKAWKNAAGTRIIGRNNPKLWRRDRLGYVVYISAFGRYSEFGWRVVVGGGIRNIKRECQSKHYARGCLCESKSKKHLIHKLPA